MAIFVSELVLDVDGNRVQIKPGLIQNPKNKKDHVIGVHVSVSLCRCGGGYWHHQFPIVDSVEASLNGEDGSKDAARQICLLLVRDPRALNHAYVDEIAERIQWVVNYSHLVPM